jgi:hypothetical protein
MTWVRHVCQRSWCAVHAIAGGSVQTYCRGRWSVTEDYETNDHPARADRCEECVRCAPNVSAGLAELEQVTR